MHREYDEVSISNMKYRDWIITSMLSQDICGGADNITRGALLKYINTMKDLNQDKRRAYYKSRYQKDYTVLAQCILVALLLTASFIFVVRALDLWAVNTCVDFGDCQAVFDTI